MNTGTGAWGHGDVGIPGRPLRCPFVISSGNWASAAASQIGRFLGHGACLKAAGAPGGGPGRWTAICCVAFTWSPKRRFGRAVHS